MITVCSVVAERDRARLDAVGSGRFTTRHETSLRGALNAARSVSLEALVVSVHECRDAEPLVATFVREFPGIATVAVLSHRDPEAPNTLLSFGRSGVRAAVDCTDPQGWQRLGQVLAETPEPVTARVLARLPPVLGPVSSEARAFFTAVVELAPEIPTVAQLADRLHVSPDTLTSRFWRAGLPSPKTYLAGMRMVYAAHHLEAPGLTVDDVASRLDFGSGQSLGRHIQAAWGVKATEFRKGLPFEQTLARYIARLIVPYLTRLGNFNPLRARVWD
ncbi:MAG TPA: helix-turn-helix domain-containing protein [Gemmatimonadales bacterium]|nr:helix-turn-helix domain-containing protein [Gemmatimonadales bacterium]